MSTIELPPAASDADHFVSTEPFDPGSAAQLTPEQERFYLASQWKLMWWKFKLHRVAVVSGIILLLMYGSTLVTEFLAPYNLHTRHTDFIYASPQQRAPVSRGPLRRTLRLRAAQDARHGHAAARIHARTSRTPHPLRFFCSGDPYRFWGMVDMSFHLVCPARGSTLFLLGTDRLGRDVLSRILYGARISLTIGLLGIAISFALGLLIGGLAGYYGGWVDMAVQRIIEIIRSFPELPLWMALSAVLPVTWSPILIYFGITGILAMLDWTGLARAVRSKLLALREEDYTTAARLMGAKPSRIIGRHLLPGS